VTFSASETDDTIEIRVSDTGLGVPLDDQERIFEKFYRSDDDKARKRGGHGLGLPLAKDIIELHQGQLTVESTLGKGAEFIITLQKEAGLIQQAI
jgi:signal transduction histidine kinase